MSTNKPTPRYKRYEAYLESEHWKQLRQMKFEAVGRACQCCGGRKKIHVHHVRYRDLTDCVLTDLVVLQEECHNDFHLALKIKGGRVEDYELPQIVELVQWFRTAPEAEKARLSRETRKKLRDQRRSQKPSGKPRNRIRNAIRAFRCKPLTREATVALIAELQSVLDQNQESKYWDKPEKIKRQKYRANPEVPKPDPLISVLLDHSAEDTTDSEPLEIESPTALEVEMLLPERDPITLTKELIDRIRTNGSFTNATLNALGLSQKDTTKGWTSRLQGKVLPRDVYRKALEGVGVCRKKRLKPVEEQVVNPF